MLVLYNICNMTILHWVNVLTFLLQNANKLNESAQNLQTLQDKELKEIKAEMVNEWVTV